MILLCLATENLGWRILTPSMEGVSTTGRSKNKAAF